MKDLRTWFAQTSGHHFTPLFNTLEDHRTVTITQRSFGPTLDRHAEMEEAIIETVETGLKNPEWTGLLYVMGRGEKENFIPLYIGKAERRGVKHEVSANIKNIRTNKDKFARWGHRLDYHIGDLSHAVFQFPARRTPIQKYLRWAAKLFQTTEPPVLKEHTTFYVIPWYSDSTGPSGLKCSLPAAEKECIALAGALYPADLLNVDGR